MIDNNPKKIVVLGMHRSGTSVVTNLLAAAGCYIGKNKDLLRPNIGNKQGYGERYDVLNTNNDILDSVGLDWMTAGEFKLEDINESARIKLSLKTKKIIEKLDEHQFWVIKDPRLCITWPFWRQYIPNVLFVICQRHPLEVAKSLYVRDGLPLEVGFALWEHYSKSIIVNSVGYERFFVDYQSLVKSPKLEAGKLISWLTENGISGVKQLDSLQIDEVINPKLYRQHSNSKETKNLITNEQSLLLASFRDGKVPDVVDRSYLSIPSNNALELFNTGRLFSKNILNNRDQKINKQNLKLAEKETIIYKLKSSLQEKEEIISQIKIQRQDSNERVSKLKVSLQEKENIILQQRGLQQESSKRISELKVSLQGKETIILQQRGQKQDCNNRISELKNSLQGKEISINQLQNQINQDTEKVLALSESIASLQKMSYEISNYNLLKFGGVIAIREELLKSTLEEVIEIIDFKK